LGIKQIDDQHKGLLDIVNDLFNHTSKSEAEERAYFREVIGNVVSYAKAHFVTEERYLRATKFPDYENHKKSHEEFILTVVKAVSDYEKGKRLVLRNFANFLRNWILSHIAISDTKYSEYFRKIATRKADGKLSITIEDITKRSALL
jgi:hemerythrin